MPSFSHGDVVRVPFPYTSHNTTQFRPALVISKGPLGSDGLLLWVAMITSAQNRRWPSDIDVTDGQQETGLPAPSVVRTLKIATIEADAAQTIGKVTAATRRSVLASIESHLR